MNTRESISFMVSFAAVDLHLQYISIKANDICKIAKNTPLKYTFPFLFCHFFAFHMYCRWPKKMALVSPCSQDYKHVLKTLWKIQCSSLGYSTACIQTYAYGPAGSSTMVACAQHLPWLSRESAHWYHIVFLVLSTNKVTVGKLKILFLMDHITFQLLMCQTYQWALQFPSSWWMFWMVSLWISIQRYLGEQVIGLHFGSDISQWRVISGILEVDCLLAPYLAESIPIVVNL
jgi:hypothetical protein